MNFQIEGAQVPGTMNENRPTLRPTAMITQNTGSKTLVGEGGMITDRSRSQNQGQESERPQGRFWQPDHSGAVNAQHVQRK